MVIATRSGLEGADSLAGAAPAAAGDGEENVVIWPAWVSLATGSGEGVSDAGGSGGSNAGATAVARPAEDGLPPSKRFQSEGGGETFQMFAGDSSSTPTWKSSRGLAGGWTDF